jgi:ferredoxin
MHISILDFNVILVDNFREDSNFLVIDPDKCIDFVVSVPEYPVNEIYAQDDVPRDHQTFIKFDAEIYSSWASITKSKVALPDADEWNR